MRIRSKWYHPFALEPDRKGTTVNVTLRRWHPAWIWLAIRYFDPRDLWRPSVWWAVARAYWQISHTTNGEGQV